MIRLILTLTVFSFAFSAHAETSCNDALNTAVKSCSRSKTITPDKFARCVIEAMTRQQFQSSDYVIQSKTNYKCNK